MTRAATAALCVLLFGTQTAPAPIAARRASEPAPVVSPSAFQELHWRFVGPFRAGWATVAEGVPGAPNTFYFGSAGGGVWKTTDAGRTWRGLMQHESSSAIGALAIAPSNPDVIYAGTGDVAARYDIAAGDGVYRSADGGETWKHVGLAATQHIGRILIDPRDPDRVLVGTLGHVFGPNPDRGVYLTTDGGTHWQQVLHVDDATGAVDLAWDPTNPSVVYAAMWQMRMHPWMDYFLPQSGPGSGVYKSVDGGLHWARLGGGLPSASLGRVGLAVARGSGGNVVYASVALEGSALTTAAAARDASGVYRSDDAGATWRLVNGDPALASSYFGRLTVAPNDANTVYVTGQTIRRSTDGGKTFDFFKGAPGGDDYHFLWIDPADSTHMIAGADQGAAVTVNGGASWSSWYNQPTGQLYHLAVDDRFPYRIYSGQQDNGTVELWSRGPYGMIDERDWHPVGGDERDYMVPKPGNPDIVFGTGLGGHMSRFDEATRQSAEVSPWPVSTYGAYAPDVKYRYTWITPLAFSPLPPHTMYIGSQVLFASDDDGDHWRTISPDLSAKGAGAANCHTPTFVEARACGFGVIFSIAPSPLEKGTIWIGTDDGLIQRTSDGGAHWANVTPPLVAPWARIDNIEPSPFDAGTAYASVDMHRMDRVAPLIIKTTDGGKHWANISSGIPADEFVMSVRADPVKRGLLFAGTSRSVYVSFDDGANWQPLSLNLPTTWYRDLLVHDGDLIAATQGRGIWILDDIEPLREATVATAAAAAAHLYAPLTAIRLRGNENRDTPWPPSTPVAENPPAGAVLDYWLASASDGPVSLTVRDAAGHVIRVFSSADSAEHLPASQYFQSGWLGPAPKVSRDAGMHRFVWDLRYPRPDALSYDYSIAGVWHEGTPIDPRGPLAVPGTYSVSLTVGGKTYPHSLTVKEDPRVHVSDASLRRQLALALQVDSTLGCATAAHRTVTAALARKPSTLSSADADSANAIADGLSTVDGVLTSLATAVVAADAPPTQGEEGVLADSRRQLDALLARWKRVAGRGGN